MQELVDKKRDESKLGNATQWDTSVDVSKDSKYHFNSINGKDAFDLFQTYGFPPEMVKEELANHAMKFHE